MKFRGFSTRTTEKSCGFKNFEIWVAGMEKKIKQRDKGFEKLSRKFSNYWVEGEKKNQSIKVDNVKSH